MCVTAHSLGCFKILQVQCLKERRSLCFVFKAFCIWMLLQKEWLLIFLLEGFSGFETWLSILEMIEAECIVRYGSIPCLFLADLGFTPVLWSRRKRICLLSVWIRRGEGLKKRNTQYQLFSPWTNVFFPKLQLLGQNPKQNGKWKVNQGSSFYYSKLQLFQRRSRRWAERTSHHWIQSVAVNVRIQMVLQAKTLLVEEPSAPGCA